MSTRTKPTRTVTLKVRKLAESRGMVSSQELGQFLSIHSSHTARLWDGEAEVISLETIAQLCNALDCQPGDLFDCAPAQKTVPV